MSQQDDELICVGHVLGAQGVNGWVRVFSNTSPRKNVVDYSPWLLQQGAELKLVEVHGRIQGKNVIAKLAGVDDRTQAERLTGCEFYIKHRQLPQPEVGQYYWSDLIGLNVETLQAEPLGVVASMMETGADDVMVVSGDRDRLIPFVLEAIVHAVDLENRRLVVDWSPEYD